MQSLLVSACPRYSRVLGGPKGVSASLWGSSSLNIFRILEVPLEEMCEPFVLHALVTPEGIPKPADSTDLISMFCHLTQGLRVPQCPSQEKGFPIKVKWDSVRIWQRYIIAVIWKVPSFLCLFCDVGVTSLSWKFLFSWPRPIQLLLGLVFMKKG